jgi:hypothetical protein
VASVELLSCVLVSTTPFSSLEVELREEHHATIAAGQHLQHGPELEPIDPSYMGKGNTVLVNKTKGDRKPLDKNELI